jgi:hypothetical protein
VLYVMVPAGDLHSHSPCVQPGRGTGFLGRRVYCFRHAGGSVGGFFKAGGSGCDLLHRSPPTGLRPALELTSPAGRNRVGISLLGWRCGYGGFMRFSFAEIAVAVGSGGRSLTGDTCRFSLSVLGQVPTTSALMIEPSLETPKLATHRERRNFGIQHSRIFLNFDHSAAWMLRQYSQNKRPNCSVCRLFPVQRGRRHGSCLSCIRLRVVEVSQRRHDSRLCGGGSVPIASPVCLGEKAFARRQKVFYL